MFGREVECKEENKKKYLFYIVCIIAVTIIFLFILNFFRYGERQQNIIEEDAVIDISNNWEITYEEDGIEITELESFPKILKYNKNKTYKLSKIIDYVPGSNNILGIVTNFNEFKVYIGNELISEFIEFGKNDNSNTAARSIHTIEIPDDCVNKELVIELRTDSNSLVKYSIKKIFIGEKSEVIKNIILSEKLRIGIFLVLLVFIGVIGYYCCLIYKNDIKSYIRPIVYLLSFAISSTLYVFSDSNLAIIVFNNAYLLNTVTYISLAFIPIPLIMILIQNTKGERISYLYVVTYIVIANLLGQVIISELHIYEYRKMLIFTHLSIMLVSLSLLVYLLINRNNITRRQKKFVVSVFPMSIAGLIDIVLYRNEIFYYEGLFFQLSTIFFMSILLYEMAVAYNEVYKESLETRIYKNIAFTDVMTGLKNRTAYEDKIKEINSKLGNYNSLWCISIDANNLKEVNDTRGHIEGDKIIINIARILNEVYGEKNSVFRVGGDEFMIFVYERDKSYVINSISEVQKKINYYNTHNISKISIAIGYNIFNKKIDNNIQDSIRISDRYMYKDKKMYKKINNSKTIIRES